MKNIALILLVAASGCAQTAPATQSAPPHKPSGAAPAPVQSKKSPVHPKPAAPRIAVAPTAPPLLPPPSATLVEPNLYRFVDSQGKVWMYRQTPFGFSKWEDTPAPAAQTSAPAAADLVSVKDLGDSVRFERKTPFGATRWVRKKTELTDDEKALLAREREKDRPTPAGDVSASAPAPPDNQIPEKP